ncbi:MAG: hypothetical protein HYV02_07960 [Deltaproteobacteria bacterium]|nr:hypothetical protein [Deltaproteobacteria bacterium]
MKKTQLIALAAAVMAVPTIGISTLFATPTFSKQVGNKPCTTCHVKAGAKDLNDVGNCFKAKKSLDGCGAK